MLTLAICDDHFLFRSGIVSVIRKFTNFHILSDVSSGEELICLLESGMIPDVILLDISMPNGMNGYEASRQISLKFPDVKVIGLSAYDNELAELGMIMSGAKGFLPKTIGHETLAAAIIQIAEGNHCCIRNKQVAYFPINEHPARHWINTLTRREMEVAKLMCSGMPYKQIASLLNISVNTLENTRTRIFEKMNCASRTEVAYFILGTGLLTT
ncbi:MAG: response regulator transcription factor [Bacteroidota bacterium]